MSPVGRPQKSSNHGPKYEKIGADNFANSASNDFVKTSPPPQAQNVSTHKIFVFGSESDNLKEIESGAIELTEIRSRKENGFEKMDELKKDHFVDHDVVADDSLAKLSLKFGCTITQLKQANGIYNDRDLFAHKTLKIPVYAHSMIWDTIQQNNSKQSNHLGKTKRSYSDPNLKHLSCKLDMSPDNDWPYSNGVSTDYSFSDDEDDARGSERRNLLDARPRTSRSLNESNNALEEYLETVDKDIKELSDKVNSNCENSEVYGHSLRYMQPNIDKSADDKKLGQAGWIGYKGILVTLCIVAVLLPLLYILYFKVFDKKR